MPIKVTCQCGKSFAAKDELAGKTVKCPSCQKPLRIPAANQPAAPAATAPKKPASKPAAPQPAPKQTSDTDDIFADIGLAPQEVGARPCPGCGSGLAPDAVVCIHCGYNTKLGRRMETVKVGGSEGEGGHGAVTTGLLERAASVIDEDKAEEVKKTKEGLPWFVWLVVLLIIGGFLGYMIIRANRLEDKAAKDKEKAALLWLAPVTLAYAGCVERSATHQQTSPLPENSV